MADQEGADEALIGLVRALAAAGYDFVAPTPATQARVNARPDNALARDLRGVFGWSRLFRPGLLPDAVAELAARAGVLRPEGDLLRSRIRVSSLGGELFVHSAYPTGEADSVFFGPDTYRFAAALDRDVPAIAGPIRRAVDIGCGSGAGAVGIAKMLPDAAIVGVDINRDALRLTRINAALAGVDVEAVKSDLLTGTAGAFDLVVANPPYLLDPTERAYRHGGGSLGEGLSLAIADAAADRLAPGGTLILYTGVAIVEGRDAFREAAVRRLEDAGLAVAYREVDPDVFGEELETPAYAETERIAAVVLTATRSPVG